MNKGFTLIELLVVIAIIGILSLVVLASLSGARGKLRLQCVEDNSVSYCAGRAGMSESDFKERIKKDKAEAKDSPCSAK